MNPELMNAMVLAYLGDSIFEALVREYLIKEKGILKTKELQKEAVHYVRASSQMEFMMYAMEKNLLEESEINTYKRGRNTKTHKSETNEHRHSTGFEAIIGYYEILGNSERIKEIFIMYKDFIENGKN